MLSLVGKRFASTLSTIKRVKILSANSTEQLEQKINQNLQQGWLLYGKMRTHVCGTEYWFDSIRKECDFFQMMVKE